MSLKQLPFLLLVPGLALAATTVLYDPASPATGPFPSDVLTTPDPLQRTGLAHVLVIFGGPAVFLLGRGILDYATFSHISWTRPLVRQPHFVI